MKLKRAEVIIILVLLLALIIFIALAFFHSFFNLWILLTGKTTASINLIPNPDFETDTYFQKTLPKYWNKNYDVAGLLYDIEYGSFGKIASITIINKSDKWIGMQTDAIPLKSNTKYKLSGMIYCKDCNSSNDFILTIHVRPKINPTANFYYTIENSSITEKYSAGYDKTEISFITFNQSDLYAYVIVSFLPEKNGTGYIDNLLLEEISEQKQETLSETTTVTQPEKSTEQTYNEIEISTLDYLKDKQNSAAKITGTESIKSNSIPDEKHPVVLYTDINVIKNRITQEPYFSWYADIRKNDWVLTYDISKLSKIDKAKYAKIMAFIYSVEKSKKTETNEEIEKYGDKARDLLLNMGSGTYKENEDVEGLIWFSESYDILKGAGYNFEKSKLSACQYNCNCHRVWTFANYGRIKCDICYICERNAREFLKSQMKDLAETSISEIGSSDLVRNNNLNIRRYSAVGVTAIVLHNKEFFDNAIEGGATLGGVGKIIDSLGLKSLFGGSVSFSYKGVGDTINYQIVDYNEGGWAEGPYYMRYAFLAAIPFMKSMENAGVQNDWFVSTPIRNLFDWGVKIRMPNGARPPFDDSNIEGTYFFNGYLNSQLYNWDWINSSKEYYSNDWQVNEIDNICYYDNSIGEEKPEWNPTQILPKAGQIIFRSGWNSNDIYLAFLGENGKAVDRGYEHEHTDSMSFILYAYGKYLAIDSGYINWDNRAKTNNPVNHNVVLTNGILLPYSYIKDDSSFSTENLDYGEISDNSAHERGILFVDKKYFLVFDSLEGEGNYEWLMHGNGLISQGTAKQYSSNAGEWTQDNVGLLAYVLAKSGDSVNFKEGIDSEEYGKSSNHTYMSVAKSGSNIGFLSLLYPSETKEYPIVSTVTDEADIMKLQKDDWKAIASLNVNNQLININEINLTTDAGKLFVKTDLENNIKYIFANDVTKINLNSGNLVLSNVPTTIVIKYSDNNIEIYYKDNGDITFSSDVKNVIYNNQERNDLYNNGVVNL